MAYVTDNELGPGGHYDVAGSWRRDFVTFLKGVDLLIHDAMYTPRELERHRGWGHSTYEESVTLAQDAGAKKVVLFHHEPEHDDKEMDALLAAARKFAKSRREPLEVIAAQEGMRVTL
jgi:ribonuclease BN (tRNA processing enzyme)